MIILKILLILLAAILLLLIALLLLKAKVTIGYRDELELTVTVLGIPIRILPKRQKQVKVRRYNLRRMRRVEEKRKKKALAAQQKASEKQRKKAQRKAEKKASAQSKPQTPIDQTLRLILSLLKIFFVRFGHHLHIDITRLRLVIATDDAAKTAILWGAVCPTVAAILELLDRGTNLHTDRATDIDVAVDYLSDSITADICIAFTLRVWHLADIGLRLLFGFLKHKSSPQSA
ncbi:MAG: hypothetical protein IJF49_02205 [Clostridia bacterium]|nr:hypothetical protein [Clostridia bacterium]